MDSRFKIGEDVQRNNQPEKSGKIADLWWDDQTEAWNYDVAFGQSIITVPESSLRKLTRAETAWQKLEKFECSGIEHFRNTLTFHKLHAPTARVAHAFASTRTLFYPHQFKPLLKFLDGGGSGILIADDVGLGKTIEAGYIMRELQARKGVEKVLVLAPARLATKWQREMNQRFEESFEIVKGTQLLNLCSKIEANRDVDPFKWIVSYEGARSAEIRAALDAAKPSIDFLIVDEAHRLRNSESQQHKLGQLLCECADHKVFLTATPVQNKLEDLWQLLKLLSETEFPDFSIFERQVVANQSILQSISFLSKIPTDFIGAAAALSEFHTPDGFAAPASETLLESIFQRLGNADLDSSGTLELRSDISSLNSFGHTVSRTRKSEAIPDCARREALWVPIRLTEPEQRIYDSVEEICSKYLLAGSSASWGFQMAALMAYRATASCIPAAIRYFEEKFDSAIANEDGLNEVLELNDGDEDYSDRRSSAPDMANWYESQKGNLGELVSYWRENGETDSKFELFYEALQTIWEEDDCLGTARRKVVVFSFFRKTLEHLHDAVRGKVIGCRMIHGGIALSDREVAIDHFLTDPTVSVLLTSEVGGEGLDLQKASVVINYDLPWNPMVVEQRIGRVDRIGQEAERIVIVNLVVAESVEERILQRLLEKIGIFESSVGEIDPIIGDQIEALTKQSLSGKLNDAELKNEIARQEQVIISRTKEARSFQTEVENLFAGDQALLDEINALTGEKQIPGERDLFGFLNQFLGDQYPGYLLPDGVLDGLVNTRLSPRLGSEMRDLATEIGRDLDHFGRKVEFGEIPITLSREVAYRRSNVNLIHFSHPLVKFAAQRLKDRYGNESFSLRIDESTVLEPGLYGFAVRMVELHGPIVKNKMTIAILEIESGRLILDSSEAVTALLEILKDGESVHPSRSQKESSDVVVLQLKSALNKLKNEMHDRELHLAKGRFEQSRAISIRMEESKLAKRQMQLESYHLSGAKEFAIRMEELRVAKAERDLEAARAKFSQPAAAGVSSWKDIAVGFLQVGS